jgi:hypothetical protein
MNKMSSAFQITATLPFFMSVFRFETSLQEINCKNTTEINTKLCFLTPLILSSFKKEVERDFQSTYSMCKTSAVHTDTTNMNKICWENNTSAVASILFAKLSDAECVPSRAVSHVLFVWWNLTQLY